MSEITIYQADNDTVEVRVAQEMVRLSQEQIANVFGVQKAAISKHLKNIFAGGELEREVMGCQNPSVSKMETVAIEGVCNG
ncbi:hypothetical protein ABHF33_13255 [Chitinibacter sp. FCG-7]|uniref:Uncharacterized protein n=1 Tax=Chitinibacter mangrovi TaxID=3153927 RepID=A0AAU7F7F4_9NEIS